MAEHTPLEVHVEVETADQRAVAALQSACDLPAQRIKHAMAQGAVWLTRGRKTQRLRRATRELRSGDKLHLYYDAAILAEVVPAAKLVADCGGYSVWHKTRGLRSQGSKWGDHCTLMRVAERTLQPQRTAYTVHRLDRAAAGLMLVAHSKREAASLARLFRERQIDKRYRAVVEGEVAATEEWQAVTTPLDSKPTHSEFRRLQVASDRQTSLLDIRIETGRKHQIRRHLAEVGYPIVGDRLYGSADTSSPDLQLCAYRLRFDCPLAKEAVDYEIDPQPQLNAWI